MVKHNAPRDTKKTPIVTAAEVYAAAKGQNPLPEDSASDEELLAVGPGDSPVPDAIIAEKPATLIVKTRGVTEELPILKPGERPEIEPGDLILDTDPEPPVLGLGRATPSIVGDVVAASQRRLDQAMAQASCSPRPSKFDHAAMMNSVRAWLAIKSWQTISNLWHKARMTLSLPTTTHYDPADLDEITAAVQAYLADDDFIARCLRWAARCRRVWGINTLGMLVIAEAFNRALSTVIDTTGEPQPLED